MAFDPVLMIMQPRQIDESINSLKYNIDIPKVWFRAFTEPQVLAEMNKFIKKTKFSHYIVMGDDGVVSKKAADTILKYGEMKEYDVFTGWMNMHINFNGDYSLESTICLGWIPEWKDFEGPLRDEYPEWQSMSWVKTLPPDQVIRTAMANFAMSIAERELFLKFPLRTHRNNRASDHHWSYRLQRAGVKVYTHPDAFVKHLRKGWSPWRHNWLVGNVEPEIRYENMKWGNREDYV